MNCTKCSAPASQTATFCEACGAPLNQTERNDPMIGRTLLNQYIIRKKLGEGGFGCVYEAEQPSMGRKVAVKTLHKHLSSNAQIVARFHREAMAASRLEHPFALKMYNSGETEDGVLWIAMEFLQGQTLDARIKKDGAMTLQELLPILEPICEILEEAHKKGIIHRDLKPENIMLTQSPSGKLVPKLLDFGISALVDDEGLATKTGVVSGTPAYMSPEQWQGLKSTDARSDIYSLGMIVYQCLSQKLPFRADSTPQWMKMHCLEEAPALSQIAPIGSISLPLNEAVMKSIQKDPAKRYQSAMEMYRSIGGALVIDHIPSTPPIQVQNASQVSLPGRPATKPPIALFVGVAAAISAIVVFALWPKETRLPDKPASTPSQETSIPVTKPAEIYPTPTITKRERSLFLQKDSGVEPEFQIDIKGAPFQGRVDAKLTVVFYGSFADPLTHKLKKKLDDVRSAYGDELKLVWIDMPQSQETNGVKASLAAEAARVQGDDKFWAMYELLFQDNNVTGSAAMNFEEMAAKVPGLDLDNWRGDFADFTHEERMRNDVERWEQLGITERPTLFINGERFLGKQLTTLTNGVLVESTFSLSRMLDRQLQRAEQQLSIGIDRKDLYADLIMDGYKSMSELRARIPGPDDTNVEERLPRPPSVAPNNVSFYQIIIGHGERSPDKITKEEALQRAKKIVELARTRNIDFQRLIDFYSDNPSNRSVEAAFPGKLVKPVEDVAFAMSNGQVSEPIDTLFGYIILMPFESTSLYESLKSN